MRGEGILDVLVGLGGSLRESYKHGDLRLVSLGQLAAGLTFCDGLLTCITLISLTSPTSSNIKERNGLLLLEAVQRFAEDLFILD